MHLHPLKILVCGFLSVGAATAAPARASHDPNQTVIRVLDASSGKPLAGTWVAVDEETDQQQTDGEGLLVLEYLEKGPHHLDLEHEDYLDREVTIRGGGGLRTVKLRRNRDFRRDVVLRGESLDAHGKPRGGQVRALCGPTDRTAEVGADGRFRLEHLAPGNCHVWLEPSEQDDRFDDSRFLRIDAKMPPLRFEHSAASARVRVRVAGTSAGTGVAIFAGEPPPDINLAWSCIIGAPDAMGGARAASCAWPGENALLCQRKGELFVCEGVPHGRQTVVVNDFGPTTPGALGSEQFTLTFEDPGRRLTIDVDRDLLEVTVPISGKRSKRTAQPIQK